MQYVHSENNRNLRYRYPNVLERSKKLGEMWHNLSPIERGRYKSAYTKEINQFNENLTEEERELMQLKRSLASEKRMRRDIRRYGKKALEQRPKSSLNNPFALFVKQNASKVPEAERKNLFAYLSQKWRNLGEEEKLEYTKKYNQATRSIQRRSCRVGTNL